MPSKWSALCLLVVVPCTTGCRMLFPVRPVELPPPAVDVTDSGVVVEDVASGDGPAVERGARVRLHYTGWTAAGERFDSTHDRGRPVVFTVGTGAVVRGWDDGMVGMRAGGVRRLTIPSELAYGAGGLPGRIPPTADITLELELLAILDRDAPDEE